MSYALKSLILLPLLWLIPAAQAADVYPEPAPSNQHQGAFNLSGEPVRPLPVIVEVDPRKQALGRKLFFNPMLSKDERTSCASCHRLPPVEEGGDVSGVSEPMGSHNRSVPLLYNVSLASWLNWDGGYYRLKDLLEASFPTLDKMNIEWHQLMPRVTAAYGADFEAIYGAPATPGRVVDVLENFLRSLGTPNGRFDRYLRGEADALTPRERQGYALFKEIGCSSCHNGVLLGANFFEEFYIYRHEPGDESEPRLKDLGRYYVTADEADRNVFRVPTLRNVALSAPYFHDGSADTLADAVEEMIEHQLGLEPEKSQIDLLVVFLQTLTGQHAGVNP